MMDRLSMQLRENFKRVESVAAITSASSLAYHGLLTSVERLRMYKIDLSSVPSPHLAALASCVEKEVKINKVNGCDLVSLITSIRHCENLEVYDQCMRYEEAEALLEAYLKASVKDVQAHDDNFVRLVKRKDRMLEEIISSPNSTQEDIDTARHQIMKVTSLQSDANNHWDYYIYV